MSGRRARSTHHSLPWVNVIDATFINRSFLEKQTKPSIDLVSCEINHSKTHRHFSMYESIEIFFFFYIPDVFYRDMCQFGVSVTS